jgi:hypothetical protein
LFNLNGVLCALVTVKKGLQDERGAVKKRERGLPRGPLSVSGQPHVQNDAVTQGWHLGSCSDGWFFEF